MRRHWAEEVARDHLLGLGWRHLSSNYRQRTFELDLVMLDGETVVIVEVKQRNTTRYGGPAAAIDNAKLHRLRRGAQHYLAYEHDDPGASARVDAVLVTGTKARYELLHLQNVG